MPKVSWLARKMIHEFQKFCWFKFVCPARDPVDGGLHLSKSGFPKALRNRPAERNVGVQSGVKWFTWWCDRGWQKGQRKWGGRMLFFNAPTFAIPQTAKDISGQAGLRVVQILYSGFCFFCPFLFVDVAVRTKVRPQPAAKNLSHMQKRWSLVGCAIASAWDEVGEMEDCKTTYLIILVQNGNLWYFERLSTRQEANSVGEAHGAVKRWADISDSECVCVLLEAQELRYSLEVPWWNEALQQIVIHFASTHSLVGLWDAGSCARPGLKRKVRIERDPKTRCQQMFFLN